MSSLDRQDPLMNLGEEEFIDHSRRISDEATKALTETLNIEEQNPILLGSLVQLIPNLYGVLVASRNRWYPQEVIKKDPLSEIAVHAFDNIISALRLKLYYISRITETTEINKPYKLNLPEIRSSIAYPIALLDSVIPDRSKTVAINGIANFYEKVFRGSSLRINNAVLPIDIDTSNLAEGTRAIKAAVLEGFINADKYSTDTETKYVYFYTIDGHIRIMNHFDISKVKQNPNIFSSSRGIELINKLGLNAKIISVDPLVEGLPPQRGLEIWGF